MRPRRPSGYRACLLDALGTMVRLRPPWEELDPALVEGISAERVRAAFRAEMSFYAANADRGRDADSLAALRAEAAAVLARGLGRQIGVAAMMGAIRFEAYPDALPALTALRERGLRTVCVSNWDYELPAVLERIGLAVALDGVVTSAAVGARKPDPAIFAAALPIAGCSAAEALHVGDSDDDVAGARAAGIDVVRIDRHGGGDVSSLAEIVERMDAGRPAEGPHDDGDDRLGPPRVGSTPPPGAPPGRRSEPPPAPPPSTPPPDGREPDRASGGGRFLTRYAGLPEVGWRGGTVAIGVLVAAGVMLAGTIVVVAFNPGLDTPAARDAAQLVVALSLAGTALGFGLADAGGRLRAAFAKLGLGGRVALGAVGLAVLAWFVYIIFSGFLAPLLHPEQQDVTRELGTKKDELGSVAVAAFLIVIAAPVSEEMFFRGFMFGGLRRSMSLLPAAAISAAVWGSLHLGAGNVGVAIQLAIFGVILAWLYERSGTLWAPVLAHAVNNTIAFVVLISG